MTPEPCMPTTAPDAPDTVHPMTPEQESIWLNDRLHEGPSRYVENWVHRLRGPVDPAAVEHALTAVVARHEALRSRLTEVAGVPSQVVVPAGPVRLDQRTVLPGELDAAVRAAVARPVPLDEPPLLRATLLEVGPQDRVLAVVAHHAVLDGWCFRLLDLEFSELYSAAVAGREPELPPVPLQFGPYARSRAATVLHARVEHGNDKNSQNNQNSENSENSENSDQSQNSQSNQNTDSETGKQPDDPEIAHWRSVLDGAPAESTFPSTRTRPPSPSGRGGQVRFRIDADLHARVRALSRSLRITPFAILAAALSTVVGRPEGRRDVVIGTPVSRRDDPELEPMIACLTDLLPLRTRVEGTFAELARATKSAVWDAVAHREVSYGRLVREVAVDRSPARFPLFQVVLTVDDAQAPGLDLPDVTAERLHAHNGTAKFDAFVHLVPLDASSGGGFLGLLEYADDLWNADEAQRLADRFLTLLDDAVRHPDRPVDELRLLPDTELALLETWSDGAPAPYPEPPLAHEAFRSSAARSPDTPAVVHGSRTLSYGELDAASDALARQLVERGHAGRRIAVCLPRSTALPTAVLAALKAGGSCVPIDPAYPSARRRLMLTDSGATALITTSADDCVPHLSHPGIDVLPVDDTTTQGHRPTVPEQTVALTDLAYVVYTSGSTGRPKGVAMPHRSLAALVDWQRERSSCGAGSRTLQFAPLSFDVAFQELFATWATGGTLVLADDELRRDPEQLLDLIESQGVDRLFLPFVALQQLAEYATATGRRCAAREIVTAGEQLHITPALRTFFGKLTKATLDNQYGPSETHVVTAHRLGPVVADWPERPPIGRPLPGSRVHVLDEHRHPVPAGATGELYVAGVSLADGYLNLPTETATRFVSAPETDARPATDRLYRTGDLARHLPDGSVEFLGRRDTQVKIRGFRVEPAEIETAVRELPGIADAVVVATGTPKRLVAHCTPESPSMADHPLRQAPCAAATDGPAASTAPAGAPDATAALLAELRTRLPAHLVPAALVLTDAFPLTPSGKVDRAALADAVPAALPTDPSPDATRHRTRPRTPVEARIAGLWQQTLGGPHPPDVHEDFFEAGGDSLTAARLALALRPVLGTRLPLNSLFTAPTVAALASLDGTRGATRTATEIAPQLPPDITVTGAPEEATDSPGTVLLTGATGFLGAFLLRALLDRTDATVHCLIRAGTPEHAERRLAATLDRYRLTVDHARVKAVPGDLAAPRLGLSPQTYDRLARTVDVVHHCGAAVNLVEPYERLRAANVDGTAEILRLAAAHRTVPVHHVSTVGVLSGEPPSGAWHGTDPLPPVTGLRHGYAQSKWAAESLVGQARARGLPVTVHRPTRVTGDTATGVCPDTDFLWLLLRTCAETGLAPEPTPDGADLAFDLVAVDRAAEALVTLAGDPRATGSTFHLAAGRRLTLSTAVDRLHRHGYRIARVPHDAWTEALRHSPAGAALLGILQGESGEIGSEGTHRIAPDTARALLAPAGIDLTGDGPDLFHACVRHLRRTGFLPPPHTPTGSTARATAAPTSAAAPEPAAPQPSP
ncbi:Linear gramicidin synthase subunit D [Streptomyces sp. YIM 130001]|uniref:non-ribosomal peptide synthetase n=1 Tax=Streptomyces sp. YIM 130001 TaxID=2259644 RepID=UPI000E6476FC|nr:non-ribosomal peptide synthetase [Streptomyces sp. YIM 130001]RII13800.1 Linear gramicidin synthase subunit D [Streptomyces sp. YIM 130001]